MVKLIGAGGRCFDPGTFVAGCRADGRVTVPRSVLDNSEPAAGHRLDAADKGPVAIIVTGTDSNLAVDPADCFWYESCGVADFWLIQLYPHRAEFVLPPVRGITFYFVPIEAAAS